MNFFAVLLRKFLIFFKLPDLYISCMGFYIFWNFRGYAPHVPGLRADTHRAVIRIQKIGVTQTFEVHSKSFVLVPWLRHGYVIRISSLIKFSENCSPGNYWKVPEKGFARFSFLSSGAIQSNQPNN